MMEERMMSDLSADHDAGPAPRPATAPIWDPLVRELDEKDKFIAQLTQMLAHTRDHLGIACSALESIANREDHVRSCERALNTLKRIQGCATAQVF
jgi:hypothetical protein